MKPQPTGRLDGNDLIMTRTFRAPIEDVWTSITDSDSCARWFARWEGDAGPGKTIRWKMTHEKGDAWSDVKIERCEAPRHLAVTSKDAYGEWSLELTLEQTGDTTVMTFVHHLADKKMLGDVGPGWEYYLDMLVASRANEKLPLVWEDYYPAQKQYYLDQG